MPLPFDLCFITLSGEHTLHWSPDSDSSSFPSNFLFFSPATPFFLAFLSRLYVFLSQHINMRRLSYSPTHRLACFISVLHSQDWGKRSPHSPHSHSTDCSPCSPHTVCLLVSMVSFLSISVNLKNTLSLCFDSWFLLISPLLSWTLKSFFTPKILASLFMWVHSLTFACWWLLDLIF